MLYLCADSSGAGISFTLADKAGGEGRTLLSGAYAGKGRAGELFFHILDGFLKQARVTPSDIDRWIAVTGPGSFTGIRIGLAALSAVTLALGKELCGITSLDAGALLSRKERVITAAKLRLNEYALREYDFTSGKHGEVYIKEANAEEITRMGAFLVNGGDFLNLSAVVSLDAEGYLGKAEPFYAALSQAEINFDKKGDRG